MKRKTKQQRIEELEQTVSVLQREAALFSERLAEARRRTVPIQYDSGGALNFLPLCVESYELKQDVKHLRGADGAHAVAVGNVRAIIICAGDLVIHSDKRVL
jgi:hypothetical protein